MLPRMYFEKFSEKRRIFIDNALMENCCRKKFATFKIASWSRCTTAPDK